MASEYSISDRIRVWNKLLHIRSLHPALTWSSIADQITISRGYNFDRTYIRRLRLGKLGDARVNDVVEWVTEKYDRSFKQSFEDGPDDPFKVGDSLTPAVSFDDRSWLVLEESEEEELVAFLRKSALSSFFDGKKIQSRYKFLGFLNCAKFIFLVNLDDLPAVTHYFFVHNNQVLSFDGSKENLDEISSAVIPTLNQDNIVEFLKFTFQYVEDRNLALFGSADELQKFLRRNLVQDTFTMQRALEQFEAPLLNICDNIYHSNITFDGFESGVYKRMTLTFEGSIWRYRTSEFRVTEEIETNQKTLKGSKLRLANMIRSAPFDVTPMLEYMSQCETGWLHANLIKSGHLKLKHVAAGSEQYSFDLESLTILHQYRERGSRNFHTDVLRLMHILNQSAIIMGGLTPPDPLADIKHYSSYIHSRSLDTIRAVCKFVREMVEFGVPEKDFHPAFEELLIFEFWQAYKTNISREELYSIYAKLYDKYIGN